MSEKQLPPLELFDCSNMSLMIEIVALRNSGLQQDMIKAFLMCVLWRDFLARKGLCCLSSRMTILITMNLK